MYPDVIRNNGSNETVLFLYFSMDKSWLNSDFISGGVENLNVIISRLQTVVIDLSSANKTSHK